jgi:hypothetical protein
LVLLKLDSLEGLAFKRVTNEDSICVCQRMAASQHNSHVSVVRENVLTSNNSLAVSVCLAHACHSIHHDVSLSKCSGLIKAAYVNLSCEGDSEWLRAENLLLN